MTFEDPRLPPALAAVRRRFEHWRSTRSEPCRIPSPLWKAAVRCAAKCGLNRTVLVLGLDYNSLKRRVMASGDAPVAPSPPQAFVELVAPGRNGPADCIVEVERPGGAKLRVELRGSAVPDLAELARRFAAEGA